MARHIVLLRGINVGGRNRIAMADLREALVGAGFEDVRTYLQSGNVLLVSDASPAEVASDCERQVASRFGLDIQVVVRTRDELADVVARDPLGAFAFDHKRYQVSFLSAELGADVVQKLGTLAVAPERFVAVGREIYSWHPGGIGRSRLWARLASKSLGVTATARNWTTV